MDLRQVMAADANDLVSDESEFAEAITYFPGGHLYDPRSILAVLERDPQDVIPTASGADIIALAWRIRIATDALGSDVPMPGVDLVDVPPRIGAPSHEWKRFRIDRMLDQDDAGVWTLGIDR